MSYKLYKLTFSSAHFGDGELGMSSETFTAERLYSALILEALKVGLLSEFEKLTMQGDFAMSDAFPFYGTPYLPKPIGYPALESNEIEIDVITLREKIKKVKKISYIESTSFDDFLEGKLNNTSNRTILDFVTKNNPNVEGALYQVGVMTYNNSSLYVIATHSELFDMLMQALQYTGIGGKRSGGYGRFDLDIMEVPLEIANRLTVNSDENVMLLTTALPTDEELDKVMRNGKYLIKKSSGFAFSNESVQNFRKQDLFKFKSGSTFKGTFDGMIVDVRPQDLSHPVWNFAKPLFYKIGG